MLLADLHEERATETLASIEGEGGEASTVGVDVTVEEDARRLVATAIERYGRVDVLVNNVGISKRGSVLDVTAEEWDRVMSVNVKSMMLCSRYVVPRMKESGGGSIVNIASTAGLRAHHSTPYTTSKAAVIGLTFSMAADHGRDGIRVNAIAPGLVYTPMVAPRMVEGMRERRASAAPLGTEGTGWDVGWAAVFLASDEASWITGVTLPVDAGVECDDRDYRSAVDAAEVVLKMGTLSPFIPLSLRADKGGGKEKNRVPHSSLILGGKGGRTE